MKNKHPIIITANMITNLLLKRHSKDVTVTECKSGQSWTKETMRKFDLFAMRRSYSNPCCWIYEIKVSRQDFLRDDKWQTYLPYCTDFYFVAPPGIIDPAEVPSDAGLLLISKNARMLYCKKKAPHRTDAETPISLFKYIVMSRAKIVSSTYTNASNGRDNTAYWQNWLSTKKEKQELGYNVSKKIRELHEEKVIEVERKQKRLERKIDRFENVERILKELGLDGGKLPWNYEERIKDRLADINAGIPEKDILMHLENAVSNLKNTIRVITESGVKDATK